MLSLSRFLLITATVGPLIVSALSVTTLPRSRCVPVVRRGGALTSPTQRLASSGDNGESSPPPSSDDDTTSLCICGCGVLGRFAAVQWLAAHPGARVVGETRGDGSHDELRSLGVTPRTRERRRAAAAEVPPERFAHVLFCAPPSSYGDEEYAAEVAAAAATLWRCVVSQSVASRMRRLLLVVKR